VSRWWLNYSAQVVFFLFSLRSHLIDISIPVKGRAAPEYVHSAFWNSRWLRSLRTNLYIGLAIFRINIILADSHFYNIMLGKWGPNETLIVCECSPKTSNSGLLYMLDSLDTWMNSRTYFPQSYFKSLQSYEWKKRASYSAESLSGQNKVTFLLFETRIPTSWLSFGIELFVPTMIIYIYICI